MQLVGSTGAIQFDLLALVPASLYTYAQILNVSISCGLGRDSVSTASSNNHNVLTRCKIYPGRMYRRHPEFR